MNPQNLVFGLNLELGPVRERRSSGLSRGAVLACLVLSLAASAGAQDFGPPGLVWGDGDTGGDSTPVVGTDGSGNWVAVWVSTEDLGGTIGGDSDIFVSHSTDQGGTWSPPAVLNSNAATDGGGGDSEVEVSTDGAGNWIAVWESSDSLGGTIGGDGDILVARSTDNGVSWSAAAALNSFAGVDNEGDRHPQVVTDGSGTWIAVWESDYDLGAAHIGTDGDILITRSTDNGATWGPALALNSNAVSDSEDDFRPEVSTDGNGNWVAVWESRETLGGTIGTDVDILVARSADNGITWSAPAVLNSEAASDTGSDDRPRAVTDGSGLWIVVWQSTENLNGAIGSDRDVLFSRSTNNGLTWSSAAPLNSNAAFDSGDDQSPRIRADGSGNWVAVWQFKGTPGGDFDIVFSRSTDSGVTWSSPAALNSNAGADSGDDQDPRFANDGVGNWVVVWGADENLGGTIGFDYDILRAVGSICGDGGLAGVEGCDDGNTSPGDGCSTSCQMESGFYCDTPGSACQACTACAVGEYESAACNDTSDTVCSACHLSCASCSGGSSSECLSCLGGYTLGSGVCTDDDECAEMTDNCDDNATCTNTAGSFTCTCDDGYAGDGLTCMLDGSCTPAPLECRPSQKSLLLVKDRDDDSKDKVVWKWLKGEATTQADFADPTSTGSYSLCLYAGTTSAVIGAAEVPADAVKWRPISDKGYKYKDKEGAADGLQKLVLKGGDTGKAKALVKGRGADLPDPMPPFDLPVIVQLVNNETGVCFEGVYDMLDLKRNEEGQFRAKAQ